MGELNPTDVRRELIPLLWGQYSCPKFFVLTRRIRSNRESAEERSCLEGMYTVRMSEKWAGDESGKKL